VIGARPAKTSELAAIDKAPAVTNNPVKTGVSCRSVAAITPDILLFGFCGPGI
jgi:hypothetical protein